MSRTLSSTLWQWKHESRGKGLVFESPRGGKLKSIRGSWKSVLAEAGIEGFRWHDLRHTHASRLVAAGVSLYTVKELLGHSTIGVTERYAHIHETLKAEAVKTLDAAPSNIVDLKDRAKSP